VSDLVAEERTVVRDVQLRRGLNIVWAPPRAAGSDNALFQDGVAGHTAGKSTLCRLLRYVLGERSFAPDNVKRRIRLTLPTAWVLAEVVVDEVAWVVARPLGIGPHSFCVRDGRIDQIGDVEARLDYREFLEAVASVTTARSAAARFPATDEAVRWEHVLPWLARDQECRFADFLEWRHSSSGSEAPALNVDERQFIVRSVLGLISDAERAELQVNARLVAEKKEATRLEPLLRHQAETDRARLSKALGKDLPLSSTPLFGSEARAELGRQRQNLMLREKAFSESDRRAELRTALEDANRAEGALKQTREDSRSRLALTQESVRVLSGQEQSALLSSSLLPPRDFCNVPLRLAQENGCPLAVGRPVELAARRGERVAAEELAAQRDLVASLEKEVARIDQAIKVAEAATVAARRAYMSAATDCQEQQSRLQNERATLGQVERLIELAEEAARQATSKAEAIVQLARQIDESYARQDQIRESHQAAIGRFSARFDYMVRAILGEKVTGIVDTSGRSLALAVEEHGERESAAIATVKLLAFDFAALVTSIEGDGSFPRFLVHDGPREADMAPDVYERLFLFVHELEKCFQGEPSFQYILTTTTRPPDRFVNSPWLRLQLAGMPAEERLLRRDL
jgi:hypothetical protein